LSFSDTNEIVKVLFNWDGSDNVTLEAPFNVLLPAEGGEHMLTVYAQDEAGNWVKTTLIFTALENSLDTLLIIIGIILVFVLFILVYLYRRSEKGWRKKVEHILVLTKSGLPLYSQSLQNEELKADVVLAGGALVGISSLSSEITQASHVKVIIQENYCIMLEEGQNIILAVMIREEVKLIRKRMIGFISDFELTFEKSLKERINDTEVFEPTKEIIEKYFVN
jgi:predicted regulator of Ras-like GTPase activity (Roadblock/LC7/MglB family)